MSVNVYLDEDAVGLMMTVEKPGPVGVEYYRIDCGEPVPLGDVICLTGGQFYTLTFCKPGEDKPIYTITSIAGAVTPDSLTTRADVDCFGQLHVTGLEPSTITWTVKYPSGADSLINYLDMTDIENPYFYPDSLTPALIVYEVCGTVLGAPECDGMLMTDCAEVIVNVLPPININLDVDLTAICEDDIPPITAELPFEDPNLTYTFQWFDGPDGTGNVLSTSRTFQPPGLGTYSVLVIEITSGVGCDRDLTNFNIVADTIGPVLLVPPDTLFLDCSHANFEAEIISWIASAEAYDELDTTGSIEVFNDYTPFTPGCQHIEVVHFWAEDICSNQTLDSAYIVIVDEVAPVIDPEASNDSTECSTVEPDLNPDYLAWLADHGGARATDDCDTALVWTADTATAVWSGDPANNAITVTFTVTDECGNTDQTTATFVITDNFPPDITCPPDVRDTAIVDECYIILGIITDPTLTDDCSIPTLTWEMFGATTGSGAGTVTGESFNIGVTIVR
ncbi:MAG: hypothetical protein KAJ19_28445, partial [Gammaproteobacteria bacterium]|nr:hypothetical protein [Gammaproteobacteria bacterium]